MWRTSCLIALLSIFLNLLVCEEVQAKQKEIDDTLSLVLSLPDGKWRNASMYKKPSAHAFMNFFDGWRNGNL